jgi:pimeloyl-ACP methyl ester carboxylesterase
MITFTQGWAISAFSNFPFAGSSQVTHAMIVIHGTGRNAAKYFAGMLSAADKAGVAANTMVLAPSFKIPQDNPAAGEVRWATNDGWKAGDGAEEPAGYSSYSVIDSLLMTLADKFRFPNLNWITVVGHSAGAQFTQRYAAFGLAPNVATGVRINFVVANPSSYVYFDQERPASESSSFMVPSGSSCQYNNYKYGLNGRTGYVAKLTPRQVFQQYASRRVTYLNGSSDTVQNGDMDATCPAMLEGPNRFARGAEFFARIRQLAPSAPQDRIVVPGTAHDHDAMFAAPQAQPVLFATYPNTRS